MSKGLVWSKPSAKTEEKPNRGGNLESLSSVPGSLPNMSKSDVKEQDEAIDIQNGMISKLLNGENTDKRS